MLTFVLPNLSSLPQRGNLEERWALARRYGCGYVEVPGDLIKNAGEAERTGSRVGTMVAEDAVPLLYTPGSPAEARYILHTDPGIPRRVAGHIIIPELRWGDQEWVTGFARSCVGIARFLGKAPAAVELHSGRERSITVLARGMACVSAAFIDAGMPTVAVMENKAGQRVARARDMMELWDALRETGNLSGYGIVLDIPNLLKASGRRLYDELDTLPLDALRGFHLHFHHRSPSPRDGIDWDRIGEVVIRTTNPFVNPEVFHRSQLEQALSFLRPLLCRGERG